jgi:hypothetical protein
MRRDRLRALALLAVVLGSTPALAADAGAPDAGASVGPRDAEHAAPPHGHGGSAHADGMFEAPEDGATEDSGLPVGTLEVLIADPDGRPLADTSVTVGIVYNSVAKGESRKRVSASTNAKGVARLDGLDTGSTVAYRPTVTTGGATFAVTPFRMPEKTGMRALLHVYPVVESIEDALVVAQSVLYAEVKDDRVQVQQAFKIYNFGRSAWVPRELVVTLPPGFTAFTSQQGMSDVGVDAVPGVGARVHGTFGPGQHVIDFRWQVPYSGASEIRLDVGMPPHVAASRVMAPASKDMILDVSGFPPPQSTSDGKGQRILLTEKQLRREDPPLRTIGVVIRGLPSEGPGKYVATLLAGSVLLAGVVLGARRPARRSPKNERARLLSELEELERAHRAEEVGPKTYESARRELMDALARTFTDEPEASRPRRARRATA